MFYGAVPGTTLPVAVARRIVAAATRAAVLTIAGSAWCSSRSQLVAHPAIPLSKSELLERNERGARDAAPSEWSDNNEPGLGFRVKGGLRRENS